MFDLNRPIRVLSLLLALSVSLSANAESSSRIADYTVHYNAIQTDMLTPQIADAYGITRSNKRGLLNVAIRKDAPNKAAGEAAEALSVTATWTNSLGQMGQIKMQEIREQDAVYYIGEFPLRSTDTLNFHISVTMPGMNKQTFTLRREFFID
ncbi:DUF4426 domain-containing protein [Granulosicoccaceae sp. 1_MG-2023]|nr:DUF4426 domain-containing protein [Granulosicoccaceae sp. 1_MG-2023]